MKLLVATRSPGKMREIRRILGAIPGLEVLGPGDLGIDPDPAEDGLEPYDTFEENALSKARWFAERSQIPTVADDSGIEVDALGGAPGVRSKRFARDSLGEGIETTGLPVDLANNRVLVAKLRDIPQPERSARYVCVAALVEPGRDPLIVRGTAPGMIVDEPKGDGGFGYDPHMFDPELRRTFAEMSASEKDARSHRGKAFRALAAALTERLGGGGASTSNGSAT